MKKKALACVLACVSALALVACGGSGSASWEAADFTFQGSDTLSADRDYSIMVREDLTYRVDYSDGSYETVEEELATNRGLALGQTLEDYKKLYSIKNGYAVWELIQGDYTSFDSYTNQKPADMYTSSIDAVWLDIGYTKEDGKWRVMTDVEVRDAWFCDAPMDEFDEVVILSVYLDETGTVGAMNMEHFTYDEDWVEWQGWAE